MKRLRDAKLDEGTSKKVVLLLRSIEVEVTFSCGRRVNPNGGYRSAGGSDWAR
jgi:hypothetical protein